MSAEEIVRKHRRHIELSPGVGKDAQDYGLAVCDDILADLCASSAIRPIPQAALDFDDFLNNPPQYEDKRMVRDYRHEAYPKWQKALGALRATPQSAPPEEREKK